MRNLRGMPCIHTTLFWTQSFTISSVSHVHLRTIHNGILSLYWINDYRTFVREVLHIEATVTRRSSVAEGILAESLSEKELRPEVRNYTYPRPAFPIPCSE